MSAGILHIKDSYYFEVPKFLAPSHRTKRSEFADYWVRLDPDYQDWEAQQQLALLEDSTIELPENPDHLLADYHAWRAEGGNFAKPFDRFLEEAPANKWFQEQLKDNASVAGKWDLIKQKANDVVAYDAEAAPWSEAKIADYNHQLSGKLLIPQPFGELRNHYQMESGFGISKYMVLLLVAAILLFVLFRKVADVLQSGKRTRLTNLIESILGYIRDQIAVPTIGKHDAEKYVPFLWTLFMFILVCNLLGMIPFLGSPTASFAVTATLALTVICVTIGSGVKRFGVLGFLKNQVPHMDLHPAMAFVIVPMIWLIEMLGFFIKHLVLSIRLLANMVAGHMVLLALMGIAVGTAGLASWYVAAPLSLFGALAIDCLELLVAFLQAYVFTFLAGLFIGSAIHEH
ncbi:MAG: F0F1 ATP synthase subunit A [Planctomycetales bacterium]|nr:F0F1 ATP synthase subunit A [Planctomycetales bacterium]